MTHRPNPFAANYGLMKPMIDFSNTVVEMGLEKSLIELIKIRASQVNGCAICLDMHTRDAIEQGETAERIIMLDAWRESPLFTDRERAALAWTEALTRLAETKAPDEDYALIEAQFSAEEQVKLTLMIVVINGFNRIGVGFRLAPMAQPARQAA